MRLWHMNIVLIHMNRISRKYMPHMQGNTYDHYIGMIRNLRMQHLYLYHILCPTQHNLFRTLNNLCPILKVIASSPLAVY